MKLFIACPLAKNITEGLARLQGKLKVSSGKEKIKWVAPEKIHFTLKFLGETEPQKCSRIADALREAAEPFSPYEIVIKDGGVFPSPRRPRVLWVGCADVGNTTEKLHEKIEFSLQKRGFKKERRKFIPHLTLGRIKYGQGRSPAVEKLVKDDIYLGKMTARRVNIYQSILKPAGAEYKVVEKIEF